LKKYKTSGPLIGACSLLTVFAVLSLCVFAVLSLTTAHAERRLADASIASVTDAYAADLTAQQIFAQIRNGEIPSDVSVNDSVYSFSVPVRQDQTLYVELTHTDDSWNVQRWQTVHHYQIQNDDTISVWDGTTP